MKKILNKINYLETNKNALFSLFETKLKIISKQGRALKFFYVLYILTLGLTKNIYFNKRELFYENYDAFLKEKQKIFEKADEISHCIEILSKYEKSQYFDDGYVSSFGYYPDDWEVISKSVRIRDNYTCQECGGKKTLLHVHHKEPLSKGGSNDFDNLITLCMECHTNKHPHMEAQ